MATGRLTRRKVAQGDGEVDDDMTKEDWKTRLAFGSPDWQALLTAVEEAHKTSIEDAGNGLTDWYRVKERYQARDYVFQKVERLGKNCSKKDGDNAVMFLLREHHEEVMLALKNAASKPEGNKRAKATEMTDTSTRNEDLSHGSEQNENGSQIERDDEVQERTQQELDEEALRAQEDEDNERRRVQEEQEMVRRARQDADDARGQDDGSDMSNLIVVNVEGAIELRNQQRNRKGVSPSTGLSPTSSPQASASASQQGEAPPEIIDPTADLDPKWVNLEVPDDVLFASQEMMEREIRHLRNQRTALGIEITEERNRVSMERMAESNKIIIDEAATDVKIRNLKRKHKEFANKIDKYTAQVERGLKRLKRTLDKDKSMGSDADE